MKKFTSFIIAFLISANLAGFAAGVEILPTMMTNSPAQDKVWVGTFQLVWNDFMDKFVHNYVRFREGTPEVVWELNAKTFSTNDISSDCYYKTAGKITKKTKKQITQAIKKKFKETSDILDKLDLTPGPNRFIIYAMLKKDFEFLNAFDKLGKSKFGNKQNAEYFGIDKDSDKELAKGVNVLFYNNRTDYAVMLKTKDNDEVYLYRTSANKPFKQIYDDMNKKIAAYNGIKSLRKIDELKIPNIKFFEEKEFTELQDKRVLGTNLIINQAIESVKFEMNHKGVKLKSEAAMTFLATSAGAPVETPRYYYFDDTFVIFLKEKAKNNPYFALRVNDITKFQ